MKRQPIRYAIIRLRPHLETEEFANVGVVLVAPETAYLDYRMETVRIGRFASFFPHAGATFLRNALEHADAELARIRALSREAARDNPAPRHDPVQLFASLTKDREGVIRYSDVRHAIHADPSKLVDELFDRYVAQSRAHGSQDPAVAIASAGLD